jgi:hypothetical protein
MQGILKFTIMKTMLLYSFAIPKRHALAHKLYRRMHRGYAWFVGIPDRVYITMNGPRVALWLFFTAGGAIFISIGLIIMAIITFIS